MSVVGGRGDDQVVMEGLSLVFQETQCNEAEECLSSQLHPLSGLHTHDAHSALLHEVKVAGLVWTV